MKKNPSLIVSVISCFLVVICLIQISGLKSEISSLRSTVNNMSSQTSNDISNIYGTVREMMEEQTNQLTSSDWVYGEIDIDARCAEVVCTVVPKVYNPDVTKAALLCNGEEVPMEYSNGQYTATLSLPLFDENKIEQVLFNDEGTVRTQTLDWYIYPRYEALLTIHTNFSGGATSKPAGGAVTVQKEGTVGIYIERKGGFQLQSIEVVEILDGEEIGRIPVDMTPEAQREYEEAASKRGEAIPENVTSASASVPAMSDDITYAGAETFLYDLNKEYKVPYGGMLEIYVDVIDDHGLRYRSFVDCYAFTATGEPDSLREEGLRMYSRGEPMYILDEDGDVLFEVDKERFY